MNTTAVPPGREEIASGPEGPVIWVFTVGRDEFFAEYAEVMREWGHSRSPRHRAGGFRLPTLAEARDAAAGPAGSRPERGRARRDDGTWEPLA